MSISTYYITNIYKILFDSFDITEIVKEYFMKNTVLDRSFDFSYSGTIHLFESESIEPNISFSIINGHSIINLVFIDKYFFSSIPTNNSKTLNILSDGMGIWGFDLIIPICEIAFYDYKITYDITKKPDLVIKSHFKYFESLTESTDYNCPYITWSGESYPVAQQSTPPLVEFSTVINPKRLYLPYFLYKHYDFPNIRKYKGDRSLLCAYIVSRQIDYRDNFFMKLRKLSDSVHGLGKHNNTENKIIGGSWNDLDEVYKDYKFAIVMENSDEPGYITEKIMNAFSAGCIPIYWGSCEYIKKIFNERSFIYTPNFKNDDECIEYIIKVNNDNELYETILNEPIWNGSYGYNFLAWKYLLNNNQIPLWMIEYANILRNNFNKNKKFNNIDHIYIIHYAKNIDRKEYLDKWFIENNIDSSYITYFSHTNKDTITSRDIREYYKEDKSIFIERATYTKSNVLIYYQYTYENGETVHSIAPQQVPPYRVLSLGEISLGINHYMALKDSIDKNYKNVLILEDDAVFCKDFENTINKYMNSLPDDFDIATINESMNLHIDSFGVKISPDNVWYLHPNHYVRGTCSYIIKVSSAEKLLSTLKPLYLPIDWEFNYQCALHNFNVYWAEPPICLDGSGYKIYKSNLRE